MASNTNNNIIYIARDIERAIGRIPIDNYFIITNNSPYAHEIKNKYPENVWLIDSQDILDTYELLLIPKVQEIISRKNASIMVFKNTIHIENLCKEKGWNLLNPSAELSEKIENKITQVSWLEELASLLPPHSISHVIDIEWKEKPFILQWSHGYTGKSTILIQNHHDLDELKKKFPHREARITDFIKGPMFTANIVVTDTINLLGNISYQITGMLPFTENAFSTIGNDWSLPHSILTDSQIKTFEDIANKISQKMQNSGWKGLFGIDVVFDEERQTLYLIEINARQPASTTYESELQSNINMMHGVSGITTFDAHLDTLCGKIITSSLIQINDGAQILQRVTKHAHRINPVKLTQSDYKIIIYRNTEPNEDLIRIQSKQGIMETHNKLNKRGKEILDLIV